MSTSAPEINLVIEEYNYNPKQVYRGDELIYYK